MKLKDEEQAILESKTATLRKKIIELEECAKKKGIEKVDLLVREETLKKKEKLHVENIEDLLDILRVEHNQEIE